MCKANKASLQSQGETLHHVTISKQAIFMFPTESSSRDHVPGGPMRISGLRTEPYVREGRYEFLTILTFLQW